MGYHDFGPPAEIINAEFGQLACPFGTGDMHQIAYRICAREEDSETIRITEVPAVGQHKPITTREVSTSSRWFIPGRRQWIEIDFICEQCSQDPERASEIGAGTLGHTLVIQQHKGSTLMRWFDEVIENPPKKYHHVARGR